jgi:hypothetical protein
MYLKNLFAKFENKKLLNKIQLALVFVIISSFLFGFFIRENSAGAGGFDGDFQHVWKNLNTFKKNTIIDSIKITAKPDSPLDNENYFQGTRPPLIYILQSLNPLIESQKSFFINVFFLSILCFLFFLLIINKIYYDQDKYTVVLISSLLLTSPYFRTSAFWALEENYAIFTTIITSYFLIKFNKLEKNNDQKKILLILCIIFFSSLTVYFDQKFLIIPLLCFFEILTSKSDIKIKIFSFFLYALFSIPMLLLIKMWGNIMPTNDAIRREAIKSFHPENILYATMLIGFYLFPFIVLQKNKIFKYMFNHKKNIFFLIFLIFSLISFIFFYDLKNEINLGKGIFYKVSLILFESTYFRKIFLILCFIFGAIILYIFINKNYRNFLIIFYLITLSFFIWPYFQEYLDPIIILLILLFSTKKIILNKKDSILISLYFLTFLTFSNIYYYIQ